jgi:prevent-host-death family protein
MSRHSVVEAKNNLSDLIARAERGEKVVITRHGQPVVEVKAVQPVASSPRRMTQADLDWLDSVRIDPGPGYPGAAALIRQMRDEGY